ncbi:MAG TPA: FAD-dependent oxidoreductase [Smithellaceae bacterium]|nr:FAD-dependent oxidoreductase [Smithellaceae bacterium]HOH56463.1 FAD-dependent oxidoreductase [Smithellaceae bacterium]HPV71095.1 FAD-dependent oxidoreductase [Smithellaceae bacterium]HPY06403.1 FAD-dependent oxidoreductase [Smithellaceae bacterium]HQC09492.1 FAD-dependent oxidoreductase [Smithellaceae bacterium]
MRYPLLFSEGRIGSVILRNRVVLPPLEVGMANFDGTPSEQLIAYYEERAKNGLGLLMTGITRVNERHGAGLPRQLAMTSDRHIEPFARMVERIHRHGTKIFCQLHHPGRQSNSLMIGTWPLMERIGRFWPGYWKYFFKLVPAAEKFAKTGLVPAVVAPSAVACEYSRQRTRALSKREIRSLIKDFIQAARRVQLASGDGVELHAAHGYLIQQFLSPRTNRRTDEYGGSFENRMRFILEIIRGIRGHCGPDFPVVVRLAVDEYYRSIGKPGEGIELAQGVEIAKCLEQAGVDAIDVSSATYETMNYWLEPASFEPGWRRNLARAVKEKVKIPVLAANVIRSPEQAEAQLQEGCQDFVCLGRPHLADPAWSRKAALGRGEDIRRCISCLWCFESFLTNAAKGETLECAVNPRLGRERETAEPLRNGAGRVVVIIGAGPAGLSAAGILGLRGFKPIVLEKSAFVGGQLQLANKPPKKDKINWCFTDLQHDALKNGAEIRFNTEATPESVKALDPYAVVVATGAKAVVPPVEGVHLPHVCTVTEILNGSVRLKNQRVAVIGSGMTGLETAEKLAEEGNRVLVVEMMDQIAPGAHPQHVDDILPRLKACSTDFIVGHKLVKISADVIFLESTAGGKRREEKADAVVLSVGVKSNNALASALQPHFPGLRVIGDARRVGRIPQAVRDGFDTAWNLM